MLGRVPIRLVCSFVFSNCGYLSPFSCKRMTNLSEILRWIVIAVVAMLAFSALGGVARLSVAVLGLGLRVLVLVFIAVGIVKLIDYLSSKSPS